MFAFLRRLFGAKPAPKPPPSTPLDEQPGIIGDILRFGEAAGGNAAAAEQEQSVANKAKQPANGT